MNEMPEIGKISPAIFNELIFPRLGAKSDSVLIEPEKGMVLIEEGKETKLEHPIVDPFWKAFYGALEKYKSAETKK